MARHRASSHADAPRALARPGEGRPAMRRAPTRPGHPAYGLTASPVPPAKAAPRRLVAMPAEPEDDRALARMTAAAFLGGVGIWVGIGLWLL